MMDLVFGWPQIILSAFILLRVVVNIAKYGKTYHKTNDADRVGSLIGIMCHPFLWFGLLYWGGFFTA